jgi:flagellar biosynthesis protein FlhF
MRIKKYTADTMPDVLSRIKKEMGEDAVILHVRKIQEGAEGKGLFEVTAAVDAIPAGAVPHPAPEGGAARVETAYPWEPAETLPAHDAGKNDPRRPTVYRPLHPAPEPARTLPPVRPARSAPHPAPAALPAAAEPLDRRASAPLKRVSRPAADPPAPAEPARAASRPLPAPVDSDLETRLREMQRMIDHLMARTPSPAAPARHPLAERLCRSGVSERLADLLVRDAEARIPPGEARNPERMEALLTALIADRLPCAPPPAFQTGGPAVIALVGPTGVGKTTTIAKLAANAKLLDHRTVSLISADTFRVGAIHQLRTFAYIADLPLTVAYSPEELKDALYRAQGADLVIIDTVGRSPRDSEQVREVQAFIEAAQPAEVHLVMSATTKETDLVDVYEKFGVMPLHRLILTKLDETVAPGGLLNVMDRIRLPLSYVTTGQMVPDDIEQADALRLAQRMLEGGLYAHASLQVA